jgi:hypothetical protein
MYPHYYSNHICVCVFGETILATWILLSTTTTSCCVFVTNFSPLFSHIASVEHAALLLHWASQPEAARQVVANCQEAAMTHRYLHTTSRGAATAWPAKIKHWKETLGENNGLRKTSSTPTVRGRDWFCSLMRRRHQVLRIFFFNDKFR